jgi:hypothetical protein
MGELLASQVAGFIRGRQAADAPTPQAASR